MSPLPALVAHASGADLRRLLAGKDVHYASREARFAPANQGVFVRWSYRGPGLDLSVFGGSALDPIGVIRLPPPESLRDDEVAIERSHPRYGLLAMTASRPLGSWVVSGEAVLASGRAWNTISPSAMGLGDIGVARTRAFAALLALRYGGLADTTFTVELARTVPFESPANLAHDVDASQLALRLTRHALKKDLRLDATALVLGLTAQAGWLARLEIAYRLTEGLELAAGAITYQPAADEPSFLSGLDTHDRVFTRLRWDFTAL